MNNDYFCDTDRPFLECVWCLDLGHVEILGLADRSFVLIADQSCSFFLGGSIILFSLRGIFLSLAYIITVDRKARFFISSYIFVTRYVIN